MRGDRTSFGLTYSMHLTNPVSLETAPLDVGESRKAHSRSGESGNPSMLEYLRRQVEALQHELQTDSVTGLASRRAFNAAVGEMARTTNELAVAVFDVDRFRLIHHALGSVGAERALRSIGLAISAALPEARVIARLYGDEFAVAFPSPDPGHARRRTEAVIAQFPKAAFAFEPRGVIGGLTAGATHMHVSGNQADELLRDAMTAMHVGKMAGGRCSRLFELKHRVEAIQQLATERDILDGLHRREFEPWFQPVLDLETRELIGIEALARWNHPKRGLLMPAEFIWAAEQGGVIEELGELLARRAVEAGLRLQARVSRPLWVAINMSPRVIQSPGFSDRLIRILEEAGFPPSQLIVEITEEPFIGPTPALLDNVRKLRKEGVRIALDDFGSGYSSLGALHGLPVDILKIDRTFVTRLSPSSLEDSIVATIVAIGKRLKLSVLAEGVETSEQAAALETLGVSLAQGFWFGEVMSEQETAAWIGAHGRRLLG